MNLGEELRPCYLLDRYGKRGEGQCARVRINKMFAVSDRKCNNSGMALSDFLHLYVYISICIYGNYLIIPQYNEYIHIYKNFLICIQEF